MKRFETFCLMKAITHKRESILYSSIHMRFNNQQNQTMPTEIRTVVASGQNSGINWDERELFKGSENFLYLN